MCSDCVRRSVYAAPVELAERAREVALAVDGLLLGARVRGRRGRQHDAEDAREQLTHELAGERAAADPGPRSRLRHAEVSLRLLERRHELVDRVRRVALALPQA